jgi:dolichyldiphosphatase
MMAQQGLSTTVWKPLSLTYVTYPVVDDGGVADIIGPLLALLSLTPPFVVCALVTSTFVYRDVVAAYLLTGVLGSVAVTSLLKRIIQQPRPMRHDYNIILDMEEMDYGMPSNHSCFVFFIATFITLYCIRSVGAKWTVNKLPSQRQHQSSSRRNEQHRMSSKKSVQLLQLLWHQIHTTSFIITASISIAIICAYSRIYLLYHTILQVLVGAGLGIVLGTAWYYMFETQVTGVQRILEQIDTFLNNLDQKKDE